MVTFTNLPGRPAIGNRNGMSPFQTAVTICPLAILMRFGLHLRKFCNPFLVPVVARVAPVSTALAVVFRSRSSDCSSSAAGGFCFFELSSVLPAKTRAEQVLDCEGESP